MTPKDTPHTATQGASELGGLLDSYGRRYHEAMVASGKNGTEQRANDARKAIVEYALAQRQPAPADPQAPSQDTSRGQARAPSHASKLELEPNGHTEECNRGIGDQSQSGNCATRSDAVRASGAEPCSRSGDAAQHEVTEGRGLYGAPATSSQEALDARLPVVHLDLCASQDDTMANYPRCDCGAVSARDRLIDAIGAVLRDAMTCYPGSRETPDYAVEVALWLRDQDEARRAGDDYARNMSRWRESIKAIAEQRRPNAGAAKVSAQHGASDNSEQDQPEPGRAAIAKGEQQP